MFRQGIVGLSLALLTATPVLAQMGAAPAGASNTGGTQVPATGAPPKALGSSAGSTPTSCLPAGTSQSTTCTAPGGPNSVAPATQPPRDLLHKNAA
jgi:hypothetical protein